MMYYSNNYVIMLMLFIIYLETFFRKELIKKLKKIVITYKKVLL